LIEFGAKLLSDEIVQVKDSLPDLGDSDILMVAASGYNCGIARAIQAAGSASGDSDIHTTGKDYGKDVIARMVIFDQLLQQNAAASVT